jgi:hypothetical protein
MMRLMRIPRLRQIAPVLLSVMTLARVSAQAEIIVNGRPAVVLQSPAAKLVIDLGGGSIVDFHLAGGGLNPLRWIGPADENAVLRPMAHFLCLDRWGQPSEAELGNGMPFHGEAARVRWRELDVTEARDGRIVAAMGATLPMAGLEVRRTVRLSETIAMFSVSETVINRNKLGRIYNMVQHATIGPPFLDETTVVDSNAQRGFMQSNPMPNPEQPETRWPEARKQGQPVDLRHLTSDPDPNVVSFVVDGELGWVTATSASKELLLGYMWRTADYSWLNVWRHVADGKPLARGLEFGTTGLHQPFKVLTTKPSIFGRPTFTYLDAGESSTRSYAAFLVKVPRDFRGVESVLYSGNQLVVHERNCGREVKIPADRLFR